MRPPHPRGRRRNESAGEAPNAAPPQSKTRTVLGQAKHASRRLRLKSGKPARLGRRPDRAEQMPKRGQTGAKQNDGRARRRPQSPFARRKRKTAPPTGAGWSGKKAQPTPSPLRLATKARATFFALRKSRRATRGESPAPILAKPGAAIPTESLFLQRAADAANRPGWFSRQALGRSNKPHPRRGAKRALAASRTPQATEPQDNTNWETSRGRTAGQAHRAQSGAPQGNRREKPPANSGRRQNHFRINAVNPRTCLPTAAATFQAFKSKRCRQTPLRRTAKSLRLDLAATAETISKKVGEGRAKPAGIIKQFALDYAANDPGRSAQNNARLPNARESPSAIKPNEMKPRKALREQG